MRSDPPEALGGALVKRALLVATAALVALTTGCTADHSTSPSPSRSSSPTAAVPSTNPSSSPTPSAPPSYGAMAADRVAVHAGTISASGERRAVADALLRYLQVRLSAYHRAKVDPAALAAVAGGPAAADVRSYVAELTRDRHHTVGDVWVDVSRVDVRGSRAALTACMSNGTADVDAQDKVVERDVSAAYDVRATAATGTHGRWSVRTIRFDARSGCSTG